MFFGAASLSGFEEMGESDNLVFCVSWLESCVKVCVLVEDCKEPSEAGDGLLHHHHHHTRGPVQKCEAQDVCNVREHGGVRTGPIPRTCSSTAHLTDS